MPPKTFSNAASNALGFLLTGVVFTFFLLAGLCRFIAIPHSCLLLYNIEQAFARVKCPHLIFFVYSGSFSASLLPNQNRLICSDSNRGTIMHRIVAIFVVFPRFHTTPKKAYLTVSTTSNNFENESSSAIRKNCAGAKAPTQSENHSILALPNY